jgi:hypothetical protein
MNNMRLEPEEVINDGLNYKDPKVAKFLGRQLRSCMNGTLMLPLS